MKLASPIAFTDTAVRDATLSALGVSGRALTVSRAQTAHGLAVGEPVIDDGSDFLLAGGGDTQEDAQAVGIVSAVADANNLTVTLLGVVSGLTGITAGGQYYIADDGSLTLDTDDCTAWVTPIAVGASSTSVYVCPQTPQSAEDIPLSALSGVSTDGTLASNSDLKIPTEKAVKTYVDANSSGAGIPEGASIFWPRAGASVVPTGFKATAETDVGTQMIIVRDATAPQIVSLTILADGETLEALFDEAVGYGVGGADNLTLSMSGGAVTAAYASGTGTATLTYDLSRVVEDDETGTGAYTQPGTGIKDLAQNNLATFTGEAVVNDSEETGGGGGCTVAHETDTSSNASGVEFRYGELIWAFPFTADSSSTRCAAEFYLSKTGTSSDEIWAEIYADDGGGLATGLPTGSPLGASAHKILSDAVGALLKFDTLSVALTSGTVYWLAMRKANSDNSNYLLMNCENTTGVRFAKNDGSWSYVADRKPTFTLYATA